jgi:4-hydroxy-3-methylbut-2-enyl diphosphate reductase
MGDADFSPFEEKKGKKITDFRDLYERTFKAVERGEVVRGKVVDIEGGSVLVDVGYKSDGIIPIDELSHKEFNDPNEVVSIGEEIDVYVLKVEDKDGNLLLSKKRADLEKTWCRVLDAYKEGGIVEGPVVDRVKGGLLVDVGVQGFVPASHIEIGMAGNLSDYLGELFRMKVLEVNRSQRKVVLSRKLVIEEDLRERKKRTLEEIYEGEIREGRVVRITGFGAFVDIGGVDGLVHLSELSWRRIRHPRDVVKVGDTIKVMILSIDKEKERIALSLKQALPDPWLTADEEFPVGKIIRGRVTKVAKSYVFVALNKEIEGLIPIRELSDRKISHPRDVVSEGKEVEVMITEVKPTERRILLSIREVKRAMEKKEIEEYLRSQTSPAVTLGDRFKGKFEKIINLNKEKEMRREEPKKVPDKM